MCVWGCGGGEGGVREGAPNEYPQYILCEEIRKISVLLG